MKQISKLWIGVTERQRERKAEHKCLFKVLLLVMASMKKKKKPPNGRSVAGEW